MVHAGSRFWFCAYNRGMVRRQGIRHGSKKAFLRTLLNDQVLDLPRPGRDGDDGGPGEICLIFALRASGDLLASVSFPFLPCWQQSGGGGLKLNTGCWLGSLWSITRRSLRGFSGQMLGEQKSCLRGEKDRTESDREKSAVSSVEGRVTLDHQRTDRVA